MPDPTIPDRDADAPYIREPLPDTQEPDPFDDAEDNRREGRPQYARWCPECSGEAWHGRTCPLVREFVEGLATAVALDATIEAMKKK